MFCYCSIKCDNEKFLKSLSLLEYQKYCISFTFSLFRIFLLRKIQPNMQYSYRYVLRLSTVLRFSNSIPHFPHCHHLHSGDADTPADGGEGEKGLPDVEKSVKLSVHSSVNSCCFYSGHSKIEDCCISLNAYSDLHV